MPCQILHAHGTSDNLNCTRPKGHKKKKENGMLHYFKNKFAESEKDFYFCNGKLGSSKLGRPYRNGKNKWLTLQVAENDKCTYFLNIFE